MPSSVLGWSWGLLFWGLLALIRFGQLTHDEYFVSEASAREGVTITNPSKTDPIVMLKHFGPENPDLPLGKL